MSLRPDFAASNALLGAVLFTLKDDAAAYGVLSHAHDLDPVNAEVNDLLFKTSLSLARDRWQAKDYARCIEYLRRAAETKPLDPSVHRRLAQIYNLAGREDLSRRESEIAEHIEAAR